MSGIFRYLIVRFRPYAETGEFANIGIVAFDLNTNAGRFRLAQKRFARIGHFFDVRAHNAYSNVISSLRIELPRILEFLPDTFENVHVGPQSHFWEFRESSVIFSSPRVIKSESDLDTVTNSLFDRFVRRDFDKPENVEADLTRQIRKQLQKHGFDRFKTVTVEDELIPLRLPLAMGRPFEFERNPLVAIKPLAFDQKNPTHVIDYGAYWRKRFEYHLNLGSVSEGRVLLALEPPIAFDDERHRDAFRLAFEELRSLPFEIAVEPRSTDGVSEQILDFARRFPHAQGRLMH